MILLAIFLYVKSKYVITVERPGSKLSNETIWKYYHRICENKLVITNLYSIYKAPKVLKYIYMNENVKSILEEIKFIGLYQEDLLADIIILCEYFFKLHYNTLIGKYDSSTYLSIIMDIQKEILMLFDNTIYNIPSISTMLDIDNVDIFINTKKLQIHSITSRYIQILKRKYGFQFV